MFPHATCMCKMSSKQQKTSESDGSGSDSHAQLQQQKWVIHSPKDVSVKFNIFPAVPKKKVRNNILCLNFC